MAWKPVSNTVPQYHVSGSPASGYYLKFYKSGTTTAISMATDSTGGTTLAKCAINSEGYPINGSSAVFIPHINQPYKVALYTNSTDADADTTGNAAWVVDALSHDEPNTSVYELGSNAAAASHGSTTGYTIRTAYYDSDRVADSGGTFRFTGTTTAGKAGNWPNADGYFYDVDGKQFEIVGPVNVKAFGAVPDGSTNNATALQAAINYAEVLGKTVELGAYGDYWTQSTLTVSAGVLIRADSVPGSTLPYSVSITADHVGNGIVFDANNGSSTQVGAGCGVQGFVLRKGPSRNGGIALYFNPSDDDDVVGFVKVEDFLVNGYATPSEGLWAQGIVVNGANLTDGIKNITWQNVGVTGVSTADKYVHLSKVVQMNWSDGYIRDASSSFPSAGACGMTLDSGVNLFHATNVLTLGSMVFGEVTLVNFANCQCTDFDFVDYTGGGSNIKWIGGEISNGYAGIEDRSGLTASWQITALTDSVKTLTEAFVPRSITSNTTLTKEFSGYPLNNDGASGTVTITLPDLSSSVAFEFDITNVEAQTLTIAKQSGDTFNGNPTTTGINISEGTRVIFRNRGESTDQAWYYEIIHGDVTLTGLGVSQGNPESVQNVVVQTLSANWTGRPPSDGPVWVINGGAADRLLTLDANWSTGQRVLLVNSGGTNNLTFDHGGLASVVGAGTAKEFVYSGSAWVLIS